MLSTASLLLIPHIMAFVICLYALTTVTDAKIKYAIIDTYCSIAMSIVGFHQIHLLSALIFHYLEKPTTKQSEAFYNFLSLNVAAKNTIKLPNMLILPAGTLATALKEEAATAEGSNPQPTDEIPPVSSESSQSGVSNFTAESDKDALASDDARSAAPTM